MYVIDNLIQKILNVPKEMRITMISDKEIYQLSNNLMIANEYEQARRMEIK